MNDNELSLSICMIAHNEEANIRRALESVRGWASEIIVVDTSSDDDTAKIAADMGASVHTHANNLFIDPIKNVAVGFAKHDWILILDADEDIPDELRLEITNTILSRPPQNGFKIPRRNFYFGTELKHGGNYPDNQLRLFRRGAGMYPVNSTHSPLWIEGEVGRLNHAMLHYPYPTFSVWLKRFDFYTAQSAAVHADIKTPINKATIRKYMITRPMRRWLSRLFVKGGVRDGVPGVLAATFDFMTQVVGFGRYWISSAVGSELHSEP